MVCRFVNWAEYECGNIVQALSSNLHVATA